MRDAHRIFNTNNNPPEAYCDGKQAFASLTLANQVADRKPRSDRSLRPYRCAKCKRWHLGGPRAGVPKGGRAKANKRASRANAEET
jgi:hypothetical protein